MQFQPLALSTVLTIATLMSAPSAMHANTLTETVAQPSQLQATQAQADSLQTTIITLNQPLLPLESPSHRLQVTTNDKAYTSLLKEFTLSIHKDAEQSAQSASGYANVYGFGGNPSFDGENTPEPSLGYRHLNFSGSLN